MPLLLLVLLLPVIVIALMPIVLVQRYRVGSARRLARPWLATINAAAMAFSTAFYLFTAGATTYWVPGALPYAAAGVVVGCVVGGVGLIVTRWEPTPRSLHYTPNRWLVLAITLLVAARIVYGFWRGWHSWRAGMDDWVAATGAAGAMAAGAVVLGYYFFYWRGVRGRLRRQE